jgi:hypothetical protein
MTDDPLNSIPTFDRVSIRAVVTSGDESPNQALSEAGIFDPIRCRWYWMKTNPVPASAMASPRT